MAPQGRVPLHRMLWIHGTALRGGVSREDELSAARAALRCLLHAHPTWTQQEVAVAVGRSVAWVKKWVPRLRAAAPDDLRVLQSRSRARVHPPAAIAPDVVERILDIWDQPPEDLRRVPGPKAIL